MADDGRVTSSERLWSDEVKAVDPDREKRPEVEYQFSNGRQFVRPTGG